MDKIKILTNEKEKKVTNPSLFNYTTIYKNIEQSTISQIEKFGLPFENRKNQKDLEVQIKESKRMVLRLEIMEKVFYLIRKSRVLVRHAKKANGSYTSFVSLKCHRDCYFVLTKIKTTTNFICKIRKM